MAYGVDDRGANPHVNYEPNSLGGLEEAPESGEDRRARGQRPA